MTNYVPIILVMMTIKRLLSKKIVSAVKTLLKLPKSSKIYLNFIDQAKIIEIYSLSGSQNGEHSEIVGASCYFHRILLVLPLEGNLAKEREPNVSRLLQGFRLPKVY